MKLSNNETFEFIGIEVENTISIPDEMIAWVLSHNCLNILILRLRLDNIY